MSPIARLLLLGGLLPAAAGLRAGAVDAPLPPLPDLEDLMQAPARSGCSLSKPEAALAQRLVSSGEQRRNTLRCSPVLTAFARARARDLAERDYFAHVTPERVGPNELLRRFGYRLPDYYQNGLANNVEAIAGGLEDADVVWRTLLDSRGHRPHLLGELPFYREQDEFGIAHHYDPDTDHGHYWVVVVARRKRPGDPDLICTPAPGPCFRLSDLPDAPARPRDQ